METKMQSAAPIQHRELRYKHSKRPDSRDERASMRPDSSHAPASAKDTIARSMSRYRGNRPAKPPANVFVPSLNLSPTLKQSPATDPACKNFLPNGAAEENGSRHRDLNPRKQITHATSSPDQTSENPMPETENRTMHSPKRRHDSPRREPRPTTRGSPVKMEDRAFSKKTPQSRTNQGKLPSLGDGDSHKSGDNISPLWHIERANTHEQRADDQHRFDCERVQQKPGYERQKKSLASISPAVAVSRQIPLKKSFTERMADHISRYQSATKADSKADLKKMISTPIAIGSGGETAAPQFDAPISAVNAGERRVIVKSKDFILSLPVTPSTTSVDIICAIAKQNPGSVDVNSSVLVESFKQVGLERPLRRYEHIRDILNSWDTDTQNTLVIESSPTGGNDDDLDVRNVSNKQPGEISVYLYHSQKPGRWDKRWVTLRSDGQILVKKSGTESINICHLSDFDIYIPTPRQTAKKIKPPKKVCFAVKSQQKSSMFISTANFIHFFSTGDKKLATMWYKAVQQWRSWYLVNVMGEGQSLAQGGDDGHTRDRNGSEPSSGKRAPPIHRPTDNLESTAYLADAFAPHAIPQQTQSHRQPSRAGSGQRPSTAKGPAESNEASSGVKPTRNRAAPPVSFPTSLMDDSSMHAAASPAKGFFQVASAEDSEPQPFSTSGLLGRTYSQRQKTQNDRERNMGSRHGHSPTTHTVSINGNSDGLKRTTSLRQKPKPLVDLTPVYQEPPQHSRKGKGVVPEQLPAGGLVDIATSPEVAIPIPPTKTWRRVAGGNGDGTLI